MRQSIKKTAILIFTISLLYIALTSETILPNVAIPVKDAVIITMFIIASSLYTRGIHQVENKKLEDTILQKHAQMQTILNATPLVMYLKDTDGKIILSNKNHAKLFGIPSEQIIGQSSYSLYQDSEKHLNEDKEIIKTKKGKVVERKAQLSNGISGWYRAIKTPVINSEDKVEGMVVIFQDINEEMEIEKRKETFIATLTHDLKTPTQAQIRALDLLLGNSFGILNDDQKEMVAQIKNSCNYMNDLIFTILDTYLYDNGQTKIYPDSFNITELVNEIIQELEHLVEDKNQNIETDYKVENQTMVADRFQLKRVLINLVANAINYGFKNTTIQIIVEENDTETTINVKNKAKYIPQEELSELYQKYKSNEKSKYSKISTGLGLYLSKQIVDAHGGKVFVQSSKDETCIFGFSLPKTLQIAEPRKRLKQAV